jgi:hypothetical protein
VRAVWVVLTLLALTVVVVARRRPALPRRRLLLSLGYLALVVFALVALQGVVMFVTSALLIGYGLLLASRGGLRESNGSLSGRGVGALSFLISGGLLLAFAVGAAITGLETS